MPDCAIIGIFIADSHIEDSYYHFRQLAIFIFSRLLIALLSPFSFAAIISPRIFRAMIAFLSAA